MRTTYAKAFALLTLGAQTSCAEFVVPRHSLSHKTQESREQTSKKRTDTNSKPKSTRGTASYYNDSLSGKRTANGERYDPGKLTAAHRTLPFDSMVKVTNLENGKTAEVRINDRGPFVSSRIIDVSEAAAKLLQFRKDGLAEVQIEVLRQ